MPFFNYALFILLFVFAVLIDVIAGEYPVVIHPVVLMGRFISVAAGGADRYRRNSARFFAGAAVVVFGAVIFCLPVLFICSQLVSAFPVSIFGIILFILSVFLFKSSFSLKGLLSAACTVLEALEAGDLPEARKRTAMHLVSRDTSSLSEGEIAAAVIESIAENLTDSVVSPWLYFLIGGPAAAFGYRFVNTCDSMIGYRNEKYEWLGKFAARFDDVLNFVPARISGWLIVFSASVTKGLSGSSACMVMLRKHGVTASPNAGWTMSAAAGALGVRLEKTDCYTIEGGPGLPGCSDVRRAVKLIKHAMLIFAVIVPAVMVLLSGIIL